MSRPASRIAVAVLAGVLSACHVGPQIDELPAAVQPQGAEVELDFQKASPHRELDIAGAELLVVNDDGIVVALRTAPGGPARLTAIPWTVLHRVTATDFQGIRWASGLTDKYDQRGRENLRLVSRFPQGLSDSLQDRLLEAYRQAQLDTLGP